MDSIVIVGAGGFAREVYQWLSDIYSAQSIKGFLSPSNEKLEDFGIKKPILGTEDSYQFAPSDIFVIAVGSPKLRKLIANKIESKEGVVKGFIHPSAVVSPNARIGNGVIICPFSLVSPNATLGDHTVLNFYCSVAHDSHLGNFSVLSPYSTINGHAKLGEGVFLGTGASVAPMVTVGDWSKVSAGVALVQPLDANTLALPSPPKILRGLGNVW